MRAHPIIPAGNFIDLDDVPGSTCHSFAGDDLPEGAECPNCRKKLLLVFWLDRGAPELEGTVLRGTGRIPLLFCWTCEIAHSGLVYEVVQEGQLVVLCDFGIGGAADDFPYPDYPLSFPAKGVSLVRVDDEEALVLKALNHGDAESLAEFDSSHPHLTVPRHQLGGEPLISMKAGWTMKISGQHRES